jgi:hypothetical protein
VRHAKSAFGINELCRNDADSHDGSKIISKPKQPQCTEIAVANRSAPHGRCACFLRDFGIRILILFVPVVLIRDQESWPLRANSPCIDLAEYCSPRGFRSGWLFRPRRRISRVTIASPCSPIGESARTFMRTVAHDVTQEGPLAWLGSQMPGFGASQLELA